MSEKSRLGGHLYDRAHRPYAARRGLWSWEAAWFERRLPAAPATILLGGAGCGREALALARRGYRIDAFEPAVQLARRCQMALSSEPHGHRVLVGCYEDLSRAILDHADHGQDGNPLASLARKQACYDAVVMGWSSITHVLAARERERLVQAADRLSPNGPILLSVILHVALEHAQSSRIRRFAGNAGELIGRLRGVPDEERDHTFSRQTGFSHSFSAHEVDQLAGSIGRRVIWEADPGFVHLTLLR